MLAAGRVVVAVAGLGLLIAGAGAAGLVRAGSGLVRETATVAGVPLTVVRPAGAPPAGGRPGAVVAHGFAGSARLMAGFGDTLARDGFVVVLPDFAGHGANPARLPSPDAAAALSRDLDTAVRWLRGRSDVDGRRIALVGHSMGAGAVTRYAVAHPAIAATVAISLPDAGDLPAEPARPRDLLLLVGGAEPAGFRTAARDGLRRADPAAGIGTTVGRPSTGSGRRMVVVPAVEHISVLFAGRTHEEVSGWLAAAVGSRAAGDIRPIARILPAGLLVLAFALGLVPLAWWLLGPPTGPPATPVGSATVPAGPPAVSATVPDGATVPGGPPWRAVTAVLGGATVAAVVAALVAGLLPTARLPLAVGGYTVGFFGTAGLILAVAAGRVGWPAPVASGAGTGRGAARLVVATIALTAYAVVAVAVPTHLGLTHAVPVGARWWLLPVVAAGLAVFLAGTERLAAGRGWARAAVFAVVTAVLTAAALAGAAPGFVVLVAPVFVVLLVWQALWAAVLCRLAAPRPLVTAVGAALLAWPLATALPLAG